MEALPLVKVSIPLTAASRGCGRRMWPPPSAPMGRRRGRAKPSPCATPGAQAGGWK
jgi:hypothetical protein